MSSSRATSPMPPSRPGMLTPRQQPTSSPGSPLLRSPSATTIFPPRPPPPLHLTVRFSTSVPDLQLDILNPHQTTVVALKHLIRSRLSDPGGDSARRRLRFIHGGKILPDNAVLSTVLKPPPPPPSSGARDHKSNGHGGDASDPKGKGKHVEGRPAPAAHRVYVNCSIGDVLSAADLDAEAQEAAKPVPDRRPSASRTGTDTGDSGASSPGPTGRPGTAAAVGTTTSGEGVTRRTPRGFDRLLTAGFSAAEVNQLRLQFRSIHASRFTPDTMPSPDTMRGMEDDWIDNNDAGSRGGAGGGGGGGGGGDDGADGDEGFGLVGLVDVLIKGMVIGFMFPLGSVGWLIREEGLWSSRWQVFVSFGFILSLTIGMIRAISSDK